MIAEVFRRCVVFVYRKRAQDSAPGPWGTAFLVVVPGREPTFYAVTAGHITTPSDASGAPQQLYLRWPHKAGTPEEFEPIDRDGWELDAESDLAIRRLADAPPVSRSRDSAEGYWPIFSQQLVTDPAVHLGRAIGEGEDVFAVGLFSRHPGQEESQPTYRFGKIALMPREPVHIALPGSIGMDVEAYLVELHSWGGQSGSPVFITDTRAHIFNELPIESGSTLPAVIGFVQGHFDIDRLARRTQGAEAEAHGYPAEVEELEGVRVPINSGMAIVIPAARIAAMLEDPQLVADRAGG
jgi:hypothetical protein